MNNANKVTSYFNKIESILPTYEKAKELILEAENFSGKVVLTTINEVRSACDHLFRAVNSEKPEKEFYKAENHLKRAGTDAGETICLLTFKYIDERYSKFDSEDISKVFSKYYTEYRPFLSEIKNELVELRKRKDEDLEFDKIFDKYKDEFCKIIEIQNEVDKMYPVIVDFINGKKRKHIRNIILKIIIGVVISVFSFLIGIIWNNSISSEKSLPTETSTLSLDSLKPDSLH